jgi:hypothetical protein
MSSSQKRKMLTLDDKVKVIRLNEKGDISRVLATNFEVGKTDKFHNQEQSRNITTMGEGCRWWKKNRQSQEMSLSGFE